MFVMFMTLMVVPFYKHFRATTIGKAFLLNAIATTIITLFSIELKFYLKDHKDLDHSSKWIIGILGTLLASLVTFFILFIVFNYGGGMLSKKNRVIKFKF